MGEDAQEKNPPSKTEDREISEPILISEGLGALHSILKGGHAQGYVSEDVSRQMTEMFAQARPESSGADLVESLSPELKDLALAFRRYLGTLPEWRKNHVPVSKILPSNTEEISE